MLLQGQGVQGQPTFFSQKIDSTLFLSYKWTDLLWYLILKFKFYIYKKDVPRPMISHVLHRHRPENDLCFGVKKPTTLAIGALLMAIF